MRIVIAAPPKAGNSWLKCLLADLYDLDWLDSSVVPRGSAFEDFAAWVDAGDFPDNSIFHTHYDYSEAFCQFSASIPAHIVTILRDPYDQFVSRYFFVQAQADNANRLQKGHHHPADVMMKRPIDAPESLAYLAGGFGEELLKGLQWLESGQSVVVRYERLHADLTAELASAANQIQSVPDDRIVRAGAQCEANTLKAARRGLSRRIRAATVGDWKNHLNEEHLEIFRSRHADTIRRLGYEVF